jgi:hypothetical protein
MSRFQTYIGHTYFHNEHQCDTSVQDVGSLVLCVLERVAHAFENANLCFKCQPTNPAMALLFCRHMSSSHTQDAVKKYPW